METDRIELRVGPRILKLGAATLRADELHLSLWLRDERAVRTFSSLGKSFDHELYRLDDYPLTELVLTSGMPAQVLAGDQSADAAEIRLLDELGGFGALLLVPVVDEGTTVGLLEAYRVSHMGWTGDEVQRALVFGRGLAAVLSPRAQPRRERASRLAAVQR